MDRRVLIRFLNGLSPAEEADQVRKWLDQHNSKNEIDRIFLESWEDLQDNVDQDDLDRILHKIHQVVKEDKKSSKRVDVFPYLKVAASIFLICSFVFIFFEVLKKDTDVTEKSEETVSVIRRGTKSGEKLNIFLPDKTHVILNFNSFIEFNSGYGRVNRDIIIQGEVYFKVIKNDKLPFTVNSGELITTAIGTEFNVSSRDGVEEIALTEGQVKVETEDKNNSSFKNEIILNPGEMAFLSENQIQNRRFDPITRTAWKEGIIKFKNKSIKDVFSDLQTWYGVIIAVSGDLNLNRKVSGEFNNESLENILQGLSFSMEFDFKIDGNTVTIK